MKSPAIASGSLLKHFALLEDPRVEYLVEHRLLDIIALTLCGVICGADSWVDIEILSLKGNQADLHQDVEQLFD